MVIFVLLILTYNHGQNILDKLIRLSEIDDPSEYFAANISQFSSATVKIGFLDVYLVTCSQSKLFRVFQKFFEIF